MTRCLLSVLVLGAITSLAVPQQPAKDQPAFAPLPKAVSSLGAVVADGWLYVYGGHAGKTHEYSTESAAGTLHRLKLADPKSWEELAPGPACQGLALVEYKGKVYRIGGMQPRNKPGEKADSVSLASCGRYDPATKAWEALPDLPEGRSSHDAVVADGKLYVVGGWTMNGAGQKPDWPKTMLVLDLHKKPLKWEQREQPFVRRALTAAALAGKVYALGGLTEDGDTDLTVNVFDTSKNSWAVGPKLPSPKSNGFSAAACAVGNRLYVSTKDGKVWRLAVAGNAWEVSGELHHARFVHRMVAANDNLLLAVGGASSTGNVAAIEAIDISLRGGANRPPE